MPENKKIDTTGCTIMRGKLTTLIYNANRLTIVLKGAGRRYVKERKGEIEDETLLFFLLEEHWANSSLETVQPEEIGAITDAAIYTFTALRNEDGELVGCGPVYAFMGYEVESEIDAMLRDGYCRMTGSGE